MEDQARGKREVTHSRMLSTTQVASEYNITPRKLRYHLQRNEIPGAYKDTQGRWLIPEDSLESFVGQIENQISVMERILAYWSRLTSRPWWQLVALLIGALSIIGLIVGLLVDVPELLEPSPVAVPQATVYEENVPGLPLTTVPSQLRELLPEARLMTSVSIDLNGSPPNEFIISWGENYYDPDLAVFGYDIGKGWQPLLQLRDLAEGCDLGPFYEGVLNLYNDTKRQLVLSCMHTIGGYGFYFEVYQYSDLGLMDRIFSSKNGGAAGLADVPVDIQIINEKLYVYVLDGIYLCTWVDHSLACERAKIDPGPNVVIVEYWIDEDEHVRLSQKSVNLEVGQYLGLRARSPEDARGVDRIQYSANGTLQERADYYYAAQAGDNSFTIGFVGPFPAELDVTIVDPIDSSFTP
ncbi:protein of unknown function [Candidatus Promineifilum breve]|uniref:Helix-turn-helix domain-containing protein n=1 Tax=Candidatus Promineifilum breve TaxID=1806508 RepID=A0A170PEG7_9CHLR|nr:helix-turn-helix domain-containing protein [Candidatus Promineifilum breve]CUS02577.2 protein of unknown function [Candidatus Promineifilum breve]